MNFLKRVPQTAPCNPSRPRRSFHRQALFAGLLSVAGLIGSGLAASSANAQANNSTGSNPRVLIQTSMGDITVELYPDRAPATVANFLLYVRSKHYDGTIFHRVIRNFMIQGGGYTTQGKGASQQLKLKPTRKPIELETPNGLRNDTGWVAMARTSQPNSATAQFFINVVDNPNLNHPAPDGFGYAVFGKVIKGMEVVNKIREVPTIGIGPMQDIPHDPVIIDVIKELK